MNTTIEGITYTLVEVERLKDLERPTYAHQVYTAIIVIIAIMYAYSILDMKDRLRSCQDIEPKTIILTGHCPKTKQELLPNIGR